MINASGVVLGVDANTGYIETYTIGKSSSGTDTSLANGSYAIIGLADVGDIVYAGGTQSGELAYDYKISTGKSTSLGKIKGSSCTYFIPYAVNGPGEVLGVTAGCSNQQDQTYWTWDVHNTMVSVNAGIGSSASNYTAFQPENLNDNGQILVGLQRGGSGIIDWGILDPSSSALRGTHVAPAAAHRLIP